MSAELGNIPVEPVDGAPSKEKKRRRRGGRSREVGILAAESVIWAREHEELERSARPLLDALKAEKKKGRKLEKTADGTDGKAQDELKAEDETKDESKVTVGAETSAVVTGEASTTDKKEADEDSEELDERLLYLTDDEADHAVQKYLEVRSMEVAAEQTEAKPGSDEAAALAADASLVARINEKREKEPDKSIEAAADEAMNEVMSELELTEPEEALPGEHPVAEAVGSPATPLVSHEAIETEAPVTVGRGGGGTTPPPIRPPEFLTPLPIGPSERATAFTSASTAEGMVSEQEAAFLERRAETRGLLLGGVLGYLIGRRRGRIKTEKRLKPVQEKLEKQVTQLHDIIASKEQQIRLAAAEKARSARIPAAEIAAVTSTEHLPTAKPLAQAPELQSVLSQSEQAAGASIEQPQPVHAPETAAQLAPHPTNVFEALAAPVVAQLGTETLQPVINTSPERVPETSVSQIDALSMPELLEVAAHVNIGKENLRDIFANHRLTEPGLRHILNEYVRGGNVKKVLKQELTNKELTYERDPRMRKGLAATLSGAGAAAGVMATAAAKAKPKISKHSKRIAVASKKVGSKALEKSRQLEQQDAEMRQFIVRLWLGVTLFLGLIAMLLLLR